VSLSKDVFERRTSTGSGLFAFLSSGLAHILRQIVSIRVRKLSNSNLVVSSHIKRNRTSLPVDACHSILNALSQTKYAGALVKIATRMESD